MVDTSEAREYANANDFKDNGVYEIADEFKVKITKANPKDAENKEMRKRLAGHFKDVENLVMLNNSSRVALETKFGTETKDWIGQKCRVSIIDQNVQGSMRRVCYFKPA